MPFSEELAAELGISRTPLREALKGLMVGVPVESRTACSAVTIGFPHEDIQQQVMHELKQNVKKQVKAIAQNDFGRFMENG